MAQGGFYDQRKVARQFRLLSQNPETQGTIVNDADCMSGIPAFLTSNDKEVLKLTLQGLKFLSANPLHQPQLAQMDGIVSNLIMLHEEKEIEAPAISGMCGAILADLEAYFEGEPGEAPGLSMSCRERREGEEMPRVHRRIRSAGVGSVKKRRKRKLFTVVLVIENQLKLDPAVTKKITMACLEIKGVISVNVTMNQVILTTTRPESSLIEPLQAAIASTGHLATSLKDSLEKLAKEKETGSTNEPLVKLPSYLAVGPKQTSGRRPAGRTPLTTLPTYIDADNAHAPAHSAEGVPDDEDEDGYFTMVEGIPGRQSMAQHQGYMESTLEAQFLKKSRQGHAGAQQQQQKTHEEEVPKGLLASFLSYFV